jgi:processive 1,2-diacylglycerol beta-glucosyltransferase
MGRKIKLAILSVSAGAGHVRAAQALERCVLENYPNVEAIHLDVMNYVPKLFRKLYADSYVHIINRYPALWGYMYERSDVVKSDKSIVKKMRVAIERLNTKKLLKEMINLAPDVIVSTHFLPPELISRMIKAGAEIPPSWVQVTDFDLHGLWVHDHMTGYFAASDEVAFRMKARGIPDEIISVTGIPIMPVFSQPLSRTECASELGLNPDIPTLILMSGGLGVGGIYSLTEHLLGIEDELQIIALAGRNEELLAKFRVLAENFPGKLVPMGFTTTIERAMAASDLAITKPGGLTTSECLAMGLPMIAVSPIPGQEERNADYLLENGAALKAHDEIGVEFKVRDLLRHPEKLKRMSENAKRIGTPDAAKNVLRKVFSELALD